MTRPTLLTGVLAFLVACEVAGDGPAAPDPAAPARENTSPAGPDAPRAAAQPPDASAPKPPPAKEEPPPQVELASVQDAPGGSIALSKLPDNGRPFAFYVPKEYNRDKAWPLLVECTAKGEPGGNMKHVWQLADRFGLIVASCETWAIYGPPTAPAAVERTHEAWSRSGETVEVPQTVRDLDDILRDLRADARAIDAMADLLAKHFNVDRDMVVLTGYSGGAWVAYYAGLSAPNRYAGICIRSGSFHPDVLPSGTARARKMPIQVVVGDRDLDLVLKDTTRAEEFFRQEKFEHFQVERLPHSGHDMRPEASGNFVAFLQGERSKRERAQALAQWEKYFKAARASLKEGDAEKARHWLQKAAELETPFKLSPRASELLAKLDAGTPPQDLVEPPSDE